MADKKNYKDSLNLPKTSFDMRAGLVKKEPVIQAKWKDERLYEAIRKQREGAERFILHDGPPFANGNIHMGTTLNKVLKDMVIRIRNMTGFDAPYIPGWDCHGQPIEQKIVEKLGEKMKTLDASVVRRLCKEYAEKFVTAQSEQFQRLGIMGRFDEPYITMEPKYEAAVLEVFATLVEQGIVRKQLKPVHWSIANRTALADAELEYKDVEDTSIYVAFKLSAGADKLPGCDGKDVHLMIWTTTPWTLPANLAVAVGVQFEYSLVELATECGSSVLVISKSRLEAVLGAIKAKRGDWVKSYEVIGTVTGQQLIDAGLSYAHPLIEGKACPVVAADYVTLEDGTGLVHTAPGHGTDDYGTGLKNGLEIYCPVQADGTYDDTAPAWLQGVSVWDANPMVIEHLRKAGTLLLDEVITHSYPHDWRSKTPTIFRATEQWFIAVDKPMAGHDKSLREMALDVCRNEADDGGVDFIPAWGRGRMAGMLESRPDWCISRQRAWGLPIPAFYNEDGQPLLTAKSVRAVAAVFAEQGADSWFKISPAELLAGYNPADDDELKNPDAFDVSTLTIGKDIFDVWFESGSSWAAVAIAEGLIEDLPVDLYLEGSDQHRGWFQLSLLPALGARGKAPFKTVLTHGYVVTDEGLKMSKSLGNTMDAIDQLSKRGADILRLWVASQNYQDDIRCGEALIAQAEDAYRKIRNTLRFCMGACSDFDPAHHSEAPAEHSIDLWMKLELHRLIRDVRAAYDRYEFHRATRMIYEFCTVQASSIYLSAVKDRLYCESPNAIRRRATQTVIHDMLVTLIKLLAPILPHTCDEAWDHIPFRQVAEPHNVHLASLPEFDEEVLEFADDLRPVNPDLAMFNSDELKVGPAWIWDRLLELRSAGLIELEALRNAGVKNSLDAEAIFQVVAGKGKIKEFVETYLKELEDLLGVGYARIEEVDSLPNDKVVAVTVADTREKYPRCARSWKRRPDVGSDAAYPDLSARDAVVMQEIS